MNATPAKAYRNDGVDVEEEAAFSAFAGKVAKESYQNSPFLEVVDLSQGQFRGPRPFLFKNLPAGYFIEATADGIGTKGILLDAAKLHINAGRDLVAMLSSDITRYGGMPIALVNILDTVSFSGQNREIESAYKSAMQGLAFACRECKVAILKGETAQMNDAIGSEIKDSKTKINWSGVMLGAYHKDKMITAENISAGQTVIALKEEGFRCNGISAVRKAFAEKYGNNWWQNKEVEADLKEACAPSILYDEFLNTLNGWFDKDFKPEVKIHAIAHLSGGGIKEKFAKDIVLSKKLSAELDDLWEPPAIMRKCAEWHKIEDEEFYEVWNGGQGMLLVADEADALQILKRAHDFNIKAKIAGKITSNNEPAVRISSKLNSGKTIIYK